MIEVAPPSNGAFKEIAMGYRSRVNKSRSAGKFRSQSRRTKGINMRGVSRGGIML